MSSNGSQWRARIPVVSRGKFPARSDSSLLLVFQFLGAGSSCSMANNPQFSGAQPSQAHLGGTMDPRSFMPPVPAQFRPMMVPAQQFMPVASPHFQPVAQGATLMNQSLPSQPPQLQFPQPIQQLPARPGQPGLGPPPPPAVAPPNAQPTMLVASGSSLPPSNIQPPTGYLPGLVGPRAPISSSYTFAPPSQGQPPVAYHTTTPYQPLSQVQSSSLPHGRQLGLPSENQAAAPLATQQQDNEQASSTTTTNSQPKPTEETQTEWKEHVSANGRRYYFNRRTRVSSWEKPLELMTPIERADASTDWKEFTSPDGRKYYYNKVTKQSKWEIPEDLKLARQRLENESTVSALPETTENTQRQDSLTPSANKAQIIADALSSADQVAMNLALAVATSTANLDSQQTSKPSASPVVASSVTVMSEVQATETSVVAPSGSDQHSLAEVNAVVPSTIKPSNFPDPEIPGSIENVPVDNKEEAETNTVMSEKTSKSSLEGKLVNNQESVTYADKQEAKNAFKMLLESANVGSDWTWEQAMRVIINDRRYGALKTLGDRKQAFNEFLSQRKKQETEERRLKQKKTREEFRKMLEEYEDLTPSTRWSKAMTVFENDERFKALERERERRELFDEYLKELGEKERAKALEDRKQNIITYRQFLESCDFIKATTQWRKVQDRLEADERCSRLEKIDRLEIFQDYLHDLEKEEEEQRKIQKEEQRKVERKNRDDFRKMMEADVAAGVLTAKMHYRDYYTKVKDSPTFLAVASNTSGSTPKDLFEDVAEELEKRYHDEKTRVKDAVKLKKVTLTSKSTLEELKNAIEEDISPPPVSDVNLKIIFDELLERAKEKEEKEARKHKHLLDDFLHLLNSIKEITASSKWEDCKVLFEGSREYSCIGDENLCKKIFEDYLTHLKEQAKESERRRKEEKAKKEKEREERERRKSKQKRDKERGHDREKAKNEEADAGDLVDMTEHGETNKKHRRRHENASDDMNESDKDGAKSSHRHHSSGQRKSRRRASSSDSDAEGKHKRHRKEHRNGSRRNGVGEHVDGKSAEDKETR